MGSRAAEYQREYRAARKALGLCTDCANTPAMPGKTKCERHLRMVATWWKGNPEYARENQKTIRTRRVGRSDTELATDRSRLRPDGVKWCKKRSAHDGPLPLVSFSVERESADGLRSLCRRCDNGGLRVIAEAYWRERGIPLDCTYCDGPYEHVDHIVPRKHGGTDNPENLTPSCAACNQSKKDRSLAEWRGRR